MSAYSEAITVMTEPEYLLSSLKDLGFTEDKIRIYSEPHQLEGYHGDLRQQRANIIIPRRHVGSASNDIGFLRGQDGVFKAIISQYDSRAGHYDSKWLGKLSQGYTEHRTMAVAKSKGYRFIGRTMVDNTVKLQFEVQR